MLASGIRASAVQCADQKHVIITGASSGVGAAVARQMAAASAAGQSGLTLYLCGRNAEALQGVRTRA